MIRILPYVVLFFLLLQSCRENKDDLRSVEDRVLEATGNLKSALITPTNGWKLEYRPTPEAGSFFMILKFEENGEVNIRSDVADDNGIYFDETISYRIDNALGLELIFETFAVFHHLFEQDQATFGAEFEWAYLKKEGENLEFESISDFSDPTQITLVPAEASDASGFSTELSTNLNKFDTLTSIIFGGIAPGQQIILNDDNLSLFWTIDISKRNLHAELAGVGTTVAEIISNGSVTLDHTTGYSLRDGKIVLDDPLTFVAGGKQKNVSELSLTSFDLTGPSLCMSGPTTGLPKYSGQTSGLGSVTVINSYLSTRGSGFVEGAYSVNVAFVFDDMQRRLSEEGSISTKFPDASGFAFFYGVALTDPNIPIYSLGLITADGELYLREYQPTTTKVNRVEITLLDNYYYSATPPVGAEQDLKDITEEIFAGGEVYAFDLPVNGATVFRLINPCNQYEVFLVR